MWTNVLTKKHTKILIKTAHYSPQVTKVSEEAVWDEIQWQVVILAISPNLSHLSKLHAVYIRGVVTKGASRGYCPLPFLRQGVDWGDAHVLNFKDDTTKNVTLLKKKGGGVYYVV